MLIVFVKTKSFINGFALPTIMIASLVMLMVLLSSVTSTSSVNTALKTQNYNNLAIEAADAGLAYAKACLNVNGNAVTWSDANPLKPGMDCAGLPLVSCPAIPADASCHFLSIDDDDNDGKSDVATSFEVKAPIFTNKTFKQVSVGGSNTCAVAVDEQPYCWGYNNRGQVGDGTSGNFRSTPAVVRMVSGVLYGKTIKQISVGGSHVCAIASDDLVYCWGYDSSGQLGINSTGDRTSPAAVNMVSGTSALYGKTVKQISTGSYHTCAIASDDLAYCWGDNTYGQIGDNTSGTNRLAPVAVNMTNGVSALYGKTVKSISAGMYHTCALASDNLVYCWGYSDFGQIGDNTSGTNRLAPVAVNMANGVSALYGKTVKQVTSGGNHTCALASDNLVYCWGIMGQIGDNTSNANRLSPVAVNMTNGVSALYGKTVAQVSASDDHTCVLASDNLVYCWGYNFQGSLGDNTIVDRLAPTAVNMTNGVSALYGKTIKTINSGGRHTCVLASDNLVYCWGGNPDGQIGDSDVRYSSRRIPVAVNVQNGVSAMYGKTVKQVADNVYHACAIASDNLPYCWGIDDFGKLGNNDGVSGDKYAPVAVNMTNGVSALYGKTVKQIVVGTYFSCALASDNLVYCWGYNNYGQIGDNTSGINRLAPVAVNMTNGVSALYGKTVTQIAAGDNHVCALASDNLVYCWGRNIYGQIGDNTSGTDRLVPVAVNMTNGVSALYGKTVKSIAAGANHTCAVASDDLAYCWGQNTYNQIGDNTGTVRLIPVAVNMQSGVSALYGKTVKSIAAATYHTCAIASDNLIYCWGSNNGGQLGINKADSNTSRVPIAVNAAGGISPLYGKTIKYVNSSGSNNCVIASDDLAYCWGNAGQGQTGDGFASQVNAPARADFIYEIDTVTSVGSVKILRSDSSVWREYHQSKVWYKVAL